MGEARDEAQTQREIILRLLHRFDAAEVDDLLGMAADEVQRIAAAPADD